MILDSGICLVYKITNTAAAGEMPNETLSLIGQYWYGELSFESSPVQLTESLEQVEIAQRIRILQNKSMHKKTVVKIGSDQFYVERIFHGSDQESGELISDLSLSRVGSAYDIR